MPMSRETTDEAPASNKKPARRQGRYRLEYGTRGAPIERDPGEPPCYTGEWKRTNQPIWFSQPKLIADTDGVPAGVQNRIECGTYSSLTEHRGKRILWYPDRKHFLLGRLVPDELLADMKVPA